MCNIKKVLLILMIWILPLDVLALKGNVYIECDKEKISVSEETTCHIKGKEFDEPISSFHTKIKDNQNLTYTNFVIGTSWLGETKNNTIDLYTEQNRSITTPVTLLSFNIKPQNITNTLDISLELNDLIIGDNSFKENKFDLVTKKITVLNNSDSKNENNSNDKNNNKNNNDNDDYENQNSVLNEDNTNNKKSNGIVIPIAIGGLVLLILIVFIKKKK